MAELRIYVGAPQERDRMRCKDFINRITSFLFLGSKLLSASTIAAKSKSDNTVDFPMI